MSYCFHLYTPDLKEKDSGKFTACSEVFLNNDTPLFKKSINFYETTAFGLGKYLDIYGSCILLDETDCKIADEYSKSTFFTDFLNKYDCNGMIIRIT